MVALNDVGEPLSVAPEMRLESHRIIEDLMVATNEIVADYFEAKKIPTIYRVHESPNEEKLENFIKRPRLLVCFQDRIAYARKTTATLCKK